MQTGLLKGAKFMNKKTKRIFDINITGYDTDYVFKTIEKDGYFYEGKLLNKWTKYFYDAKVILDIGANLGNHSLYWAINTDCQMIYSFEPFKPNFELLEENVKNNNLKNVTPVNMGVGAAKSKAVIKNFDETNYGATSIEVSEENKEGQVEVIDIDSFVEENEINNIDFIKIDTEGFEENVLSGMKHVLSEMKPVLWIEVSAESYKNVFDTLSNYEYNVIDVSGFNVLFIPKTNCEEKNIIPYEESNYAENMFAYLEKVNVYYGNYIKLKDIVSDKDKRINEILENYNRLKSKNEESAQKYRTITENYNVLKSKNHELQNRNIELKARNDEFAEKYKAANENYAALKAKNAEAAEKYRTVTENYNNLKLKNEEINNKYQTLSEDYTGLKTEHGKLVDKCHEINSLYGKKLEEEYKSNADEIKMLNELKGVIKKLETQNNYLKSENAEYQRKMQLIKDTFIGKILVWGYHKYKNLKTKFVK